MATTYYNTREVELAVQEETAYGTSPGSPVAGDFFKHTSRLHFTPEIARYFREEDGSVGQGSVLGVQEGRQRCGVRIEVDACPSGTGITAPDIDLLLKNALGTKLAATANTTTGAGSSGTSLVLTTGGGASSGLAVGQLFAVDVDSTYGIEVRRVVNLVTDTVTMDRALSTDPASGRNVYVGTTYKASFSAMESLFLWQYISTNVKHAIPGLILPEYEIAIDYNSDTPIVKQSFAGVGKQETTHTESRPTPTTAGDPLLPAEGKVWIGATKLCIVQASLRTNNGRALRENESCGLYPSGVKFTGNNGYTSVEQDLQMLLSTGDTDTSAIYNAAKSAVASPLDVIVQNGTTAGKIVAWNTPKFIPVPERVELEGEMGVRLAGRCIGTAGDDDVFLAYL